MTTIFQTKSDVDNLAELRRRKAELREIIRGQRQDLNQTVQEIREDLTPARVIEHTFNAFSKPVDNGILPAILQNPTALRLATDFAVTALMRNSKGARVVRALAPAAIRVLPGLVKLVGSFIKKRRKKNQERSTQPAGHQQA